MEHGETENLNEKLPNGLVEIDDVPKKEKWTRLLLITGIVTTFGTSVPVGYNIGVINAPAYYMKMWCNQTLYERHEVVLSQAGLETLWSCIVSIFLVGGAIGSLGGSWVADKLGRKVSFLLCVILFLLSAICFQFCRTFALVELLILGRLIVGFASGLTTTTMPMYLTELAPLELRGVLGVLCSMGVTGGVVVGQIFSLQQIFGTNDLWQYSLSCYAILNLICLFAYPWLPESPKYLYTMCGQKEKAIAELSRLRGEDVLDEIESIYPNHNATQEESRTIVSVLGDSKLLLPLILVCALQGGQQLSGINAVFYYSVSIFESIGLSSNDAKWANLGAGCVNLFIAFFSPVLMTKVNRRPLSLLSCITCAVFLFILTISIKNIEINTFFSYLSITAIFGYILMYQLGLGPIPYFIGSELFEVSPRGPAMALGSLSSWTCNFIVGMTFPTLQLQWGANVFIPFGIVCCGLSLLLYYYLPETRNKDISDIVPMVADGFRSKPTQIPYLR